MANQADLNTEHVAIRNSEQIKSLKERQAAFDKDIKEIKNGLADLNTTLRLFKQSIDSINIANEKNQMDKKEKDNSIESIHQELREIKHSQENISNRLDNKDREHDKTIKTIRDDLLDHKKEVRTELKRLEEKVETHTNRTKIDWLDMVGEGITSVLSEIIKMGVVAMVVYGAMQLKK